jgi:hypothetical protein
MGSALCVWRLALSTLSTRHTPHAPCFGAFFGCSFHPLACSLSCTGFSWSQPVLLLSKLLVSPFSRPLLVDCVTCRACHCLSLLVASRHGLTEAVDGLARTAAVHAQLWRKQPEALTACTSARAAFFWSNSSCVRASPSCVRASPCRSC